MANFLSNIMTPRICKRMWALAIMVVSSPLLAEEPIITAAPRDTQVQMGETAVLQVAAKAPRKGSWRYRWFKNGAALAGAQRETLTIPNCTKSMTGLYHVAVTDGVDTVTTDPVGLYVIEPVALRYRMDQTPEHGVGKIIDATGNTAGTLIGDPLPVVVPGAAPFSGKGWDFGPRPISILSIPVKDSPVLRNFGNLENTTGMTIAFWYNFDMETRPWLSGRVLGSLGDVFKLDFAFDIASVGVQLTVGDNKRSPECKIATETRTGLLSGGKWHHYAFVLDYRKPVDENGTPINNVVVFVDGKPSKAYPAPGPQTFPFQIPFMPKPEQVLVLGSTIQPVQSGWDDFTIYSYPLTQAEIQQVCTTGELRAWAPQIVVKADERQVLAAKPTVALVGKIHGFGQHLPVTGNWSVLKAPAGAVVTFKDPAAITTSATLGSQPGKYALCYEATNTVWRSRATVVVEVLESIPLVAYASVGGKPEAEVVTGSKIRLNGASRLLDLANAPEVTYSWTKKNGPGDPWFAAPTDPTTLVSFPVPGTYVLELTAEARGTVGKATVTIKVADGILESVSAEADPPVMAWPEKLTHLTSKVTQTHSTDPLQYAWSKVSGPGDVAFHNARGRETTATFSMPGIYQLRLQASGIAGDGSADVWINIGPNSLAPVTDRKILPPVPRQLSWQPPPYVHPRYLFTEADWEDHARRAKEDPVASVAVNKIREGLRSTILNPDAGLGLAYQKMLAGDARFTIQSFRKIAGLYTKLAEACYLAWLDKDTAAMRDLAVVVANCARDELTWNQDKNGQSASIDFALCYDLAFNAMTEDQRVDCRELLVRMTKGCHIGGFHWNYLDPWFSMPLAFYQETGYDEATTRLNFDSIKYAFNGWTTSPGGWKLEDTAYGGFTGWSIAFHAVAFSRQFEPLQVTGGLARENLMEMYFLYPDVTTTSANPRMGGFSEKGWPNSGQQYLMHKYFYPTDPLDDLIRCASRQAGKSGSLLNEAIFGIGPLDDAPTFASVAASRHLPLTRFDPQRGIGVARSDWSPEAMKLDFDCRFDTFASGHIHGNRNDLTLFSLGREWLNGPGYGNFANELHASVLIDGKGSARSPGRFVDVVDRPEVTMFAGDAKVAYDYQDILAPSPTRQADTAPLPFAWKDLMFPGSSDGKFPPLSPAPYRFNGNQDNITWINDPVMARTKNGQFNPYNPVKKAFRSAILVRGERPYVIVVDDLQKDDQPHDYVWTAHIPETLMMASPGNATETILYHKSDAANATKPQCLVRVLQGEGKAKPITIITTNPGKHNSLQISRTTVIPDYKVLLFPHLSGEDLPQTTMNGPVLTVTLPNGIVDRITFAMNPDGRTRISFERVAHEVPMVPAPRP